MTLDPLWTAPAVIQFHVVAAFLGLSVGPFVLFRQRRDRWHKRLGYVWLTAMIAVAVTGLMIESEMAVIWHLGPIHLFSFFTIWGVAEGLWHILHGDVARHKAAMQSLWFGAMGLAGLFTLLPGRTINRMLFGGPSDWGWAAIAVGLVGLWWLRRRFRLAVL